jgi:hypothetical protein
MEVSGKLFAVMPVQTGEGRNGAWEKQDFVIETEEKYPKKIAFTLMGDKMSLIENRNTGDMLNVKFSIESREYNGKYYHNINAFAVSSVKTQQAEPANADPLADPLAETPTASPVSSNTTEPVSDELPF